MKKILFVFILMLVCSMANAQIKVVVDEIGIPKTYEFSLGKYVFSGVSTQGNYNLNWSSMDYDEVEMLYGFVYANMDDINKRFDINITEVNIREAVRFIDYCPYLVSAGWCVSIVIETDAHTTIKEREVKEKEERISSLQNIF